jgi:bacteriorhodopsin
MFSGMGWETVTGCRQYFYIRHIDWAITCPLIIFSLGILATQDLATTLAGESVFAGFFCFYFSWFFLDDFGHYSLAG